jgi:hypothetical protein
LLLELVDDVGAGLIDVLLDALVAVEALVATVGVVAGGVVLEHATITVASATAPIVATGRNREVFTTSPFRTGSGCRSAARVAYRHVVARPPVHFRRPANGDGAGRAWILTP